MGRFQLPLARDALDSLAGTSIFSTMDVKSGFWHIEVHPNLRERLLLLFGMVFTVTFGLTISESEGS